MQFNEHEDDFSPAFSVWPIDRTSDDLYSNSKSSGRLLEPSFNRMLIDHLIPIFLLENKFFEFKFYR